MTEEITEEQIALMKRCDDFVKENRQIFNFDRCYGIDMIADVHKFAKGIVADTKAGKL